MNFPKRTILGCLTAAMLFGPWVYMKVNSNAREREISETAGNHSELLSRYGFYLLDATRDSGVEFQHQKPNLDKRLDHIEPQLASMGASVSVVDFDRDGWQDFYLTNSRFGQKNALYHNQQDGTFVDIAEKVGLADLNKAELGSCMGAVWADIDNDSDEDVLIYRWGKPELYRNDGDQGFTEITSQSELPEWANLGCATWLDYDRDGLVDLLLAGYWSDDIQLASLEHTRIMPESFEYADNGGSTWLFKNQGDGSFTDVTKQMGIESNRWTLAVIAADFDQDQYPDLFFANDYGMSELFHNQQGESFQEIGKAAGIGFAPKSGMNASVGDVLNQGMLAIYETNISEEGVLIQGNNLWCPRPNAGLKFDNMASVMGVELGGWSFGAQFGDLNNDGFLDIYLTNGYVSGEEGTSYWYDFSEITGGNQQIISEAMNWPDMKGRSLSGYQPKRLWLNDGAGQFQEVSQLVGASDRYDGRGVALADLDNDGDLDVLVANQDGPVLIYKNQTSEDRNWIAFELEGNESNHSAIGAQLIIEWDGQQQLQEIVAASGYAAQNQKRVHFGLGDHEEVERVTIRWPSGKTQVIPGPAANKVHTVVEPSQDNSQEDVL